MKYYKSLFKLLVILIFFKLSYAQESIGVALDFIDSLKVSSPKVHGISLNSYSLSDLDNDGIFEVIEKVNRIENESPGFLPSELSLAFEFNNIYAFNKSSNCYELSLERKAYKNYLTERRYFYQFWLKQIKNPLLFNSDTQEIIKLNEDYLISELLRLINLIEGDSSNSDN